MVIILSASYLNDDLKTEFGNIPSAFIPLQNKRLYQWQIDLFSKDEKIVLTVPKSYNISHSDLHILNLNNIEIIYVPENLTLGMSVVYVLNFISKYHESIKLLHGDTFYETLPQDYDTYLISETEDNYGWAKSKLETETKYIYTGYFSFSDQSLVIKSIIQSDYDFIRGILKYSEEIIVNEVLSNSWLDFGHGNTYYTSKTKFTTQRSFNNLLIDNNQVKKSSENSIKIEGEINWYKNLPEKMKHYTPSFYAQEVNAISVSYSVEYLYLNTLADLYVFGRNELFIWEKIISSCFSFLDDCKSISPNPNIIKYDNIYSKIISKTDERIKNFKSTCNIDFNHEWIYNGKKSPSISVILRETNKYLNVDKQVEISIIHGDFCFSNILFDFRKKNIKVIDPRGLDFDGKVSEYGSIIYDIAKLGHSIIGLYDFIIVGYFYLKEKDQYNIQFDIPIDNYYENLKNIFKSQNFKKYNCTLLEIYAVMINLFISMLPLHSDSPNRQKAFIANVYRLYYESKEISL